MYYEEKFKGVNSIIIDGAGLLEYSYNAYQESLALISKYGEVNNIPVIFNAIGRAGEFDPEDYRCKVLMSAFNYDSVKYVSARDSRDAVQKCVGNRFEVKLLADAAFCVDEAFKVKAKPLNKIGIGLIRGDASLSYSEGFGEADWLELFSDIANELEKQGFYYEFFTNGMQADYDLGCKLIEKMQIDKKLLVDKPKDAGILINTIASYDGIITCRMHSSIAAFTLGIPSIILSWNNKVDKYMEIVGYSERAVQQQDFDAETIVEKMRIALNEGVSESKRIRMKELARQSVNDYINLLITSAE